MTKTTTTTATTTCLLGYAWVSTGDQTTDQQVDALRAAGCETIFIEPAMSGSTTSRPELDRCLAALEAGDTLVVVRLDRLGRSALHILATVRGLAERGIAFRSLDGKLNVDPITATGKFTLGVFALVAELERDLIRERTRDALAAKKRRGEPLGRPHALTASQ